MLNTNTLISAFSSSLLLSCLQAFVVFVLIKLLFALFPRLTSSMRYILLYVCLTVAFCLFHYSWIGLYIYISNLKNETPLPTFDINNFLIKDLIFFQIKYAHQIFGLYSIGFLIHLILFFQAIYKVRKIKRQAGVEIQEWTQVLERLKPLLGIVSTIRIYISDKVVIPCTVGFIKPIIYIPTALVNQLTVAQVEAIILHELAHIKRNDYLFNIIQRVMEMTLFFNPFSWLISRMIRREREFCCDEEVVTKSNYSSAYARALLLLEENKLTSNMAMALNGLSKFSLLKRIKQLSIFNQLETTAAQRVITLTTLIFITLSLAWTVPYNSSTERKELREILKSNIEALVSSTPNTIANLVLHGVMMQNETSISSIKNTEKQSIRLVQNLVKLAPPNRNVSFYFEQPEEKYASALDEILQRKFDHAQKLNLKGNGLRDVRTKGSLFNDTEQISAALDSFNKVYPTEKLFIHTDKPYYAVGDTLWFKSYLFNATNLSKSSLSGLLYAELITDSGRVVKRISVPVNYGLSRGQIILDKDEFDLGSYTLRAYTNWMQNFGEESFFKKTFHITNLTPYGWLVKEQHRIEDLGQGSKLHLALEIKNSDNRPFVGKDLQLKFLAGKKTVSKRTIDVVNGKIEGSFDLSEKFQPPFVFTLQDKADPQRTLTIPLTLNQPQNIDLQFMPESGYLVAGLPVKVGFKALGSDGLSREIEGRIVNSKNSQVTTFKSIHNGMGTFEIIAEANETYFAEVRLSNGTTKKYSLPVVQNSGTSLKINSIIPSDSIKINVLFSKDLLNGQQYKLMGFSNGETYYAAKFKVAEQRTVVKVPKKIFPTGIAHFTLFGPQNQPLNERIVFINHNDNLKVELSSDKSIHFTRDSIPVKIKVTNAKGKPVKASFSLAVTDDALIKNDLFQENILSKVFLTSDLKGNIESAAFYLSNTEQSNSALDALMLTQGWVGYNWETIFKPLAEPKFKPEKGLKVSGRVLNAFDKPLVNSKIILMSLGKYKFYSDTITDEQGRFSFEKFPPMDTVGFYAQARNPRGKSFNVGIEFDQFSPAKTTQFEIYKLTPWYLNSDPTLLNFVKTKADDVKQKRSLAGKNVLDDVVIIGKRRIKKSKNLNGPGEADQVISESQMDKNENTTLLHLLETHVNGFHLRAITPNLRYSSVLSPRPPVGRRFTSDQLQKYLQEFYFINDKRVKFIVDGVRLDQFVDPSDPNSPFNDEYTDISRNDQFEDNLLSRNEYYDFITNSLNSVNANDVVGIEVMYRSKYVNSYENQHLSINHIVNSAQIKYAFIEITTRSGQGLTYKSKPGVAVLKPLPITFPKQFYSPKYTTANINSPIIDYRSTIHWDSNVYSDENGNGFTSFYAADRPGTYTVIVQGSNMNGLIGYKSIKLDIAPLKREK